jgi:hypothetical protein
VGRRDELPSITASAAQVAGEAVPLVSGGSGVAVRERLRLGAIVGRGSPPEGLDVPAPPELCGGSVVTAAGSSTEAVGTGSWVVDRLWASAAAVRESRLVSLDDAELIVRKVLIGLLLFLVGEKDSCN